MKYGNINIPATKPMDTKARGIVRGMMNMWIIDDRKAFIYIYQLIPKVPCIAAIAIFGSPSFGSVGCGVHW